MTKFFSSLSLGALLLLAPVFVRAEDAAKPATASADSTTTASATNPLHPRYKMSTTLGDIVLELDGEKAPVSTLNFDKYVSTGYYKGTIFHRVMPSFMIQGGGFTASIDEKQEGLLPPIINEWENGLKNNRGTISMARTADPDSGTSQFFINVVDNPMLDDARGGAAYAVFGKVVEGMDTVDKIKDTDVSENPKYPSGDGPVVPTVAVVINDVKLLGEFDKPAVQKAADAAKAKKEEAAKAKKAAMSASIDKIVADAEKKHNGKAEKTASGLTSIVLKKGTGDVHPKASDNVTVHYVGTLPDGSTFDSSVKRGQPATFPLGNVIPGWTEGVQLMTVGEKRLFVIPSNLAYGPQGRPPVIPPNATLIFEVELIKIN